MEEQKMTARFTKNICKVLGLTFCLCLQASRAQGPQPSRCRYCSGNNEAYVRDKSTCDRQGFLVWTLFSWPSYRER